MIAEALYFQVDDKGRSFTLLEEIIMKKMTLPNQ
jgi:hypothetical protein